MARWRALVILVVAGCLVAWLGLLWLEQAAGVRPYSRIEDRLYLGGAVDVPPPGTRAVVNLCEREDRYSADEVLWMPLEGVKPPSIAELRKMVEFIGEQRRAGRTTYVHYWAGVNRSGMVVTAYLMYEHGWPRDQALAFVQSRRPEVQPNPVLMRFLVEWEDVLAKTQRE